MVAYLFAGQGAQYVGMGKDLYEAFPESKAIFDKANKILGFSISQLCFAGPQEELTKTQNCQPAILTMSVAAYEAFKATPNSELRTPNYTAGLSLGEYSALVASEALSFEDAVYLVRRRGEFMEEEARKIPGKMLSVIGLDIQKIKELCHRANTEIANLNCPGQIVVSGQAKEIEAAGVLAKELGAKMAITLDVSGAFHSSLMKEAGIRLSRELEKVKIKTPSIPIVSNVEAKPVTSPSEIKDNLVKQVSSSVLWEDSMRFLLSQGTTQFFEFGPGKVLKGLMRRIDAHAVVTNIEKKEDVRGVADETQG